MAPCYNYSTRNLHYRTQSLPEAVYNNAAMLQHLGQAEYHAQDKLHAMALHHHNTHGASAITKKKVSLKRSQTNACDLVLPSHNYHSQQHAHRPAPLTAGVYEAFLPPPNLNAIGLPINGSSGYHHQTSRAHSFYMPSNVSTQSSSNLNLMGSQQNLTSTAGSSRTTEHMLASSSYHSAKTFSNQLQAPRSARNLSDQATSIHTDNKYAMPFHLYHHRSVPNISAPQPQSLPPSMPAAAASPHSSLTTPLFVDCSVEYDLGDHPPVPANSEPLLTIHPEYVIKSSRKLNSSPYSLHPQNSNHIRGSKIKGVSPRIDINEKSCVAAGGDLQNLVNSGSSVRRQLLPPHHLQTAAGQQAASRYSIATRRAQQQQAAVHQYQLEQQQKQLQQLHHSSGGGSNGNNSMSVKLANTGVFSDGGSSDLMSAPSSSFSNCGKLDAMRKLSVESWDSGIGLMTSSAAATGGYTTTATASNGSISGDCSQWQQQHGANSESCDNNSSMAAANHFQPPPSYSYSSSALAAAAAASGGCGSHYQRSLPHHHSELISSAGKNINNNNSSNNKKFAFSGEYYWNCFLFC